MPSPNQGHRGIRRCWNATHVKQNASEKHIPQEIAAVIDGDSGLAGWHATFAYSHVQERVTWRFVSPDGETRYLKVSTLGQELSLAAERDRMRWAAAHLPVPSVVDYGIAGEHEWLLTTALAGVDATDASLRADPPSLVPLLAAGLRRFHSIPFSACPFDSRIDTLLRTARQRVAAGLVDANHDFHAEHGVKTAAAALKRLEQLRPEREDLVVCHGDYCLPNVLIHNSEVGGYVDLGNLGIADRWWDLAIATWSITWNLGPGWEDLFLESYGIERDPKQIAFYRLLYDLVP
jgi:aminoglycoside phosphotransferase